MPAVVAAVILEVGLGLSPGLARGAALQWSAPASISSHGLGWVSYPSATLCVALSGDGYETATTDPAAGASMWSAPAFIAVHPTGGMRGLACVDGEWWRDRRF
ncbi:MAG: hypothetical protein ACLP01_18555 [Solirubrobacteraceae bacterium]